MVCATRAGPGTAVAKHMRLFRFTSLLLTPAHRSKYTRYHEIVIAELPGFEEAGESEVAAGIVMRAVPFGWNRRFTMSAWKPLVLGFVICGTLAGTVHADGISWPSGLDNWVVYLAAPGGNAGTGPLSYNPPQTVVAAPQATPPSTPAPPVQPRRPHQLYRRRRRRSNPSQRRRLRCHRFRRRPPFTPRRHPSRNPRPCRPQPFKPRKSRPPLSLRLQARKRRWSSLSRISIPCLHNSRACSP